MATIQVVLDDALLRLTDEYAQRESINRSAVVREAVRVYLKQQRYRELERQERKAYERKPDDLDEVRRWEGVADWPDE